MDPTYVYVKKRSAFGRPAELTDSAFPLYDAGKSGQGGGGTATHKKTVIQSEAIGTFDTSYKTSVTEVNCDEVVRKDQGCTHVEGGWPKDVDRDDNEQKKRFLRKMERGLVGKNKQDSQASLLESVREVVPHLKSAGRQNNAIDVTEEYFAGESTHYTTDPPGATLTNILHDPSSVRRTVSSLDWSSDSRRVVGAYAILNFQDERMSRNVSCDSYIWNLERPNAPSSVLSGPSPLCCLQFNPRSPDLLVGGCYNGLVALFDSRTSDPKPTDQTLIDNSHHDPVYQVSWIQSKTGNMCASSSTDGQILWWDIRRMQEPVNSVKLGDNAGNVFGCSSMAYSMLTPHKYLVGTEQGLVVSVNSKMRNKDRQMMVYDINNGSGTDGYTPAHYAPIASIERNAQVPKYFLTVADWTARIWCEDLETDLLATPFCTSYLSAGCWSPTRPSVFFLTRMDGTVEIWDIFDRQNEPVYSHHISDTALSSVAVSRQGQNMAVGDENGKISILNLSEAVVQSRKSEKFALVNMLEREVKREKALLLKARKNRTAQQPKKQVRTGLAATKKSKSDSKSGSTSEAGERESGDSNGEGNGAGKEGDATAALLKKLEESFYASIQSGNEL